VQVYQAGTLQLNRFVPALDQLSQLGHDELKLGAGTPLSVEVQRSADYFERQLRQRPVKEVILAVASPHREALQQQLEHDLGLAIRWAEYPSWTEELGAENFSDFPVLGGVLLAQQLLSNVAGEVA
jgi:MSHA biogenesis protein MshI